MINKDEAKKLGFEVVDSLKTQNPLYENLKTHFPQTIDSDGKPNLQAIATLLGISDKADMQGYELTFSGKGLANALYSTPCNKELKLDSVFKNPPYQVSPLQISETRAGDLDKNSHAQAVEMRNFQGESVQDFGDKNGALQGEASLESNINIQDNQGRNILDEKSGLCSLELGSSKEAFTDEVKGKLHDLSLKDKPSNATHTQNTIIRGDNLDVLKLLKSAYSEKIKMIYIDPPYNTKNDNFIYPDDFRKDYQEILKEVGLLLEDEKGEWVESESLRFFKNITGSKSHSGWLCFMLPRLKLARDLLREDGVIFISIDDNEQANLKILCDEIFGEENFVGDFIRKTKSTTNDAKIGINYQHEFLLCYAKDKDFTNLLGGQKDLSKYKNPDNDPNGEWVSSDPSAKSGDMKTGYFVVKNPYTGKEDYPPEGRYWRFSQNTMQKHIDEGRICFKKEHKDNERGFIYKRHLKDLKTSLKTFDSLKFIENSFMNQGATKELFALGMGEYFTYPKGVDFIKEIINHATNDNSDFILDFFAGSGTTAQAVMQLNAEDGGDRKFILVQIDEPIREEKSKIAYDFCKNELKSENPAISDITIERVKRAGAKIAKEHKDFKGDVGFSVYSLCDKPSLVCDEEGRLKLLAGREGVSPSDIARNLALQCGKELDKELECIINLKLYKCEDVYCVVECDKEVLEILSKTKNEYIFIDGYADIKLEAFLNLKNSANISERLKIVY